MKKIILTSTLLFVFFLTGGIASAHRLFIGFRFFPPVIVAPPPAIMVSPPAYYSHPYYGSDYNGYRVWIPGYWDTILTNRGWERVWIRGHWEYRP
jgi:hypothetical protein